jgi:hypothetical protein
MNTTFRTLAILTAAGAIALAGSPAVAKMHVRPAPVVPNVPADAHGALVAPNGPAQHVYAPSLPVAPYTVHGLTPDFQLSHQ